MNISISSGNIKMGKIPSVSLPAITTCRKDCAAVAASATRRGWKSSGLRSATLISGTWRSWRRPPLTIGGR